LEEETGNRGLEELGDTGGRAVGAVSSAEGVVDEEISVGGELGGEVLVVLLLLGVEADVLEENNVTVLHFSHCLSDRDTNAIRDKGDGLAEELSEARGDGREGVLGLVSTLGAAQVGREEDLGTLGGQVLDGGDGTTDAGIISDLSLLERNVEVGTNENSEKKMK